MSSLTFSQTSPRTAGRVAQVRGTALGQASARAGLWITWEVQRRNEELARAFGVEHHAILHESTYGIRRYLWCILDTVRLVRARRPEVVFCQSPSVVLVMVLALLRAVWRFTLVADLHNAGVEALSDLPLPVRGLYRAAVGGCSGVIVSNEGLLPVVSPFQSQVFVLPDRIPSLRRATGPVALQRPAVVVISSFAKDEPLAEILTAAQGVGGHFYVTGKRSKAKDLLRFESETIHFTDYLAAEAYDALLREADLVIDLTTRTDCLVCGAYEALAAGTPAILSDSAANRATFEGGFLFTDATVEALRASLRQGIAQADALARAMPAARRRFERRWDETLAAVRDQIAATRSGRGSRAPAPRRAA